MGESAVEIDERGLDQLLDAKNDLESENIVEEGKAVRDAKK